LIWPTLQARLFELFSAALQQPRYSIEHPVEMRLAAFLLDLSTRWQRRGFAANEFSIALPRQDIARLLAMRKETLSRVFTRFEELGYVRADRKRIELLNLDALRQQAGSLQS
jgi:CRP/FNR family transcriptional regulator